MCLYGWPKHNEKHFTWELIDHLAKEDHDVWLVMGDYNQVLSREDKRGGLEANLGNIFEFREVLENCELREIAFSGPRFTWDMGVWRRSLSRRDSITPLQMNRGKNRFSGACVTHLCRQGSDDVPVMVHLLHVEEGANGKRTCSRLVRFESLWAKHEGCEAVVHNAWSNPSARASEGGVQGRVHRCMEDLKELNRKTFGNVLNKM